MSWGFWAKQRERGDTIVEVLLAIVIISVVIAGAYEVTNRGLRIGQTAIERTQASERLSGQAEILRSLRDLQSANPTMKAKWDQVVGKVSGATPTGNVCSTGGGTPTSGSKPFWLDTASNPVGVTDGTTTNQYLKYWIEAYRPSPGDNYIDFYINGCWQPIGSGPIDNTSIVVRLVTN